MLMDPRTTRRIFNRMARLAILGSFFSALIFVSASSPPPRILHQSALSYPSSIEYRLISRSNPIDGRLIRRHIASDDQQKLKWDDRFILSFKTDYDADVSEPVRIALRPSTDLIHSQGIKYVETHLDSITGQRTRTEKVLHRKEAKVYEGVVIPPGDDLDQWIKEEESGVVRQLHRDGRGWAKIVVSSDDSADVDGNSPSSRFQGAYEIDGEPFTIHYTDRYLAFKDVDDPEPPKILSDESGLEHHPRMVLVREAKTLSPTEHLDRLRKRGSLVPDLSLNATSCGHDHLPFNTDPEHPVLGSVRDQTILDSITTPWVHGIFGLPSRSSPSSSEFSIIDRQGVVPSYPIPPTLVKRQSGGDISGSSGSTSNFINQIGSTQGCPRSRQVVFIGVAADCTYTAQFSTSALAREQILNDFNAASTVYQNTFNVSLGIVELNVQTGSCPTTSAQVDSANPWNVGCEEGGGPGLSLNDRLSVFSQWRGNKGGSDNAGLWHLVSNCSTGSEVGVAWLGQLCRVQASGAGGQITSGTGVSTISRSTWQVIAHEIGHNFGAIHDCASGCTLSGPCCPLSTSTCNANADYIMSPVSARNTSTFSPCSIGNICFALGNSLNTSCLRTQGASSNPPIISIQSCGNGILEEGEECDPGGQDDPCCNPTTCRFINGAVCSSLNSLCCNNCQIATNGTVCRPAQDSTCDIAEVCPGNSAECPVDRFRDDGTSCGSNGLACATGVCTSQTQQCRNAGSSLGLDRACQTSSSSCSITCQNPNSALSCVRLDQTYRDGTPCGSGGRCRNGDCAAGSALDTVRGWYRNNLQTAIPVTIVGGLLVLAILYAILRCCCCGGRRGQKPVKAMSTRYGAPPPPPPQHYSNAPPANYGNSYYPPPPPPQPAYGSSGRGNWVDPSQYNGNYDTSQFNGRR